LKAVDWAVGFYSKKTATAVCFLIPDWGGREIGEDLA
jgi:hypothetical protein